MKFRGTILPYLLIACASLAVLASCSRMPEKKPVTTPAPTPQKPPPVASSHRGNDVVLYSLGLIDTGYRFGGKNPEAGLDCSGMVSYVYSQAAGVKLAGSAADIARLGRPVAPDQLRPGDLVFFNTAKRPHSHVGIYIGDRRFVHAPNSRGKVRINDLKEKYYAQRFEEARTYFD